MVTFKIFAASILLTALFAFIKMEHPVSPVSMGIDYDHTKYKAATFAGGCFWCMEPPYGKLKGVQEVVVGYTGGKTINPTYEEVCSGTTGHKEAVLIIFDPQIISYAELLDVYWKQIDPTDPHGQFVDKGDQYKSVIYYHDETQQRAAEASKEQLNKSRIFSKPVITEILPAVKFYPAEDYHQNYPQKNPTRYKLYRSGSGRDNYIEQVWGNNKHNFKTNPDEQPTHKVFRRMSEDELKSKLTPMQYKVTQKQGTEPAFNNEYWKETRDGIYVDIVSGEPLFSSKDKYDAGCGWPSFTKPIQKESLVYKKDRSLMMDRTEVRSKTGDAHLGHVFEDGPKPTGERYCINSASLRFVSKDDLIKEGYGEYTVLFNK